MPKAVVSQDTERFDLKELPGAFVELRRLSYGEILRRRDMVQTVRDVEPDNGNKRGRGMEGVFHVSKVTHFNFSRAVIDHNLEDEDGRKLNLSDYKDLNRLDPKVAAEIEDIIVDMNEPTMSDEDKEKVLSFRGSGEAGDSAQPEGSGAGS